jgi:hypothetical protein
MQGADSVGITIEHIEMFHAVSPYYVACREIGFSRRRDIERLAQSMHVVPPAALSSTFCRTPIHSMVWLIFHIDMGQPAR